MLQHRGPTPPKLGPEARSLAPKWKPKGPNVAPIWFPTPFKIYPKPPKIRTGPWATPPGLPQDGQKNANATKRWVVFSRSPHFLRKSGQHGPKLGPKLELKWTKIPFKNQSKNGCILGSVFGRILMDFGRENGGKLAPKSIKNRCQVRKAIF